MEKPSLLYVSPFPPQQTGIANHSSVLVRALADHFDITLYIDNGEIASDLSERFLVVRHGVDTVRLAEYNHRLYHIGNNPGFHRYIYRACLKHPDTVVLHETVIYYLTVGIYEEYPDFFTRLFEIGGPQAVATLKSTIKEGRHPLHCKYPEDAPMNEELLKSGNRFIVHSRHAREEIRRTCEKAAVRQIPLAHDEPARPAGFDRGSFLRRVGLPEDATLVASFGFVAPTKLNHVACRAIKRWNQCSDRKLHFVMVGEGNYVDELRDQYIRVTGFIPQDDYYAYLHSADLVLNLRYPTMGETSAALLDAMWASRPCVVMSIGWFAELPDNAVLKLDADRPALFETHLHEAIAMFMQNRSVFEQTGRTARQYVGSVHSTRIVAGKLAGLLEQKTWPG